MSNVMRHEYRKLSEEDLATIRQIKDAGKALHDLIETLTPGREVSIAKTKTEEAVMWAVKSVTS
jgi:hypothetical protein